jgi:transcriptional regulator EpsA
MALMQVGSGEHNSRVTVPGDTGVLKLELELLLETQRAASSVSSHSDFYNWLQNDVSLFIPHQTLLATWGNFQSRNLQYDLSSSIPGLNTRNFRDIIEFEPAVTQLFERGQGNSRNWYILKNFRETMALRGIGKDSRFFRTATADISALLVYTMRNERDNHDCVYVFSLLEDNLDVDPLIFDLLMPHVDATLRRIKCLPEAELNCGKSVIAPSNRLSAREHEVMEWVSAGKSNQEIGGILDISHNTVKNHLKRIFNKMGVTARSQAVHDHMVLIAKADKV